MALIAPPGNELRPQRVTMYWAKVRFGSSAERVCGFSAAQMHNSSARRISRVVREPPNNDLHRMLQLYYGCAVNIERNTDGFYARRWYARRESVLRNADRPT